MNANEKKKNRILLVEDHPATCIGMTYLINRESDLEVCGSVAESGKVLGLVASLKPQLATIDVTLRDGNGFDLMRELKAHVPSLLLLVVTADDEAVCERRAIQEGANGYVSKIEAGEHLVHAIRRVLNGCAHFSESILSRTFHHVVDHRRLSRSGVETLSQRERQVLTMLGWGFGRKEIATRLSISVKTVESYQEHLKLKLDLNDSVELKHFACSWGRGRPSRDCRLLKALFV